MKKQTKKAEPSSRRKRMPQTKAVKDKKKSAVQEEQPEETENAEPERKRKGSVLQGTREEKLEAANAQTFEQPNTGNTSGQDESEDQIREVAPGEMSGKDPEIISEKVTTPENFTTPQHYTGQSPEEFWADKNEKSKEEEKRLADLAKA